MPDQENGVKPDRPESTAGPWEEGADASPGHQEQGPAEGEVAPSIQGSGRPKEMEGDEPEDENAGSREQTVFPIIGVGASAGGLEAMEALFSALPGESGLALVVITHTDPEHASLLPEILRRNARVPVRLIENGMRAESNTIYIPPSNRDAILKEGVFHLKKRPARSEVHMPVDLFLRSLAADRGERAGCVILSGTGTDGTQGVRMIKEKGGLVVVQSIDSARHTGMPQSALDTGLVDYILAPPEVPERLKEYYQHPAALKPLPDEKGRMASDPLQRILTFLANRIRHDFSLYKKSTLVRRIERRMTVNRSQNAWEYLSLLQRSPDEIRSLFQDLLIGVTNFFRDPEAFDFLKDKVLPELIPGGQEGGVFRVWVPGCSTGEEAYSVAIILKEFLDEQNRSREVQIFGTDIDQRAIEKGRQGAYLENIAADVSSQRLKRFFTKKGNLYLVKREIREMTVFAEQNVLQDPPFINLDLLVCRNLLIYLKPEGQARLFPLFYYTLKRGGTLFLGTSESIGRFTEFFEPISKQFNVYQKKESLVPPQVQFPTGARNFKRVGEEVGGRKAEGDSANIEGIIEKLIVREYTPACVVVNQNGEITYFHGRTGRYLEPAQGRAQLRIADMAKEGLRIPLLSAMRRINEEGREIRQENLSVKVNGEYQRINLVMRRFREAPLKDSLLIVFEDLLPSHSKEEGGARQEGKEEDLTRVENLEEELMRLRENHRSSLEELETSNEELRSTNEEMQSANEELESSREELQSLNEELNTVNTELHSKMQEIKEAYKAITDVLNSTQIAIVFLDKELRLRRFTKEATRLIRLIDSDVGRPIDDVSHNLDFEGLPQKARDCLRDLKTFEEEIRTKEGQWYRMRIMVYRTNEQVIEGVVLTFVNIDAQKNAQQDLEAMSERAVATARKFGESIIDTVRESLLVLDPRQRVVTANRRFYETFRKTPGETEGKRIFDLCDRRWDIPELRRLLGEIVDRGGVFEDYLLEQEFPEVGFKRMLLNGRVLEEEQKGESKILLAMEDVTGKPNSHKG